MIVHYLKTTRLYLSSLNLIYWLPSEYYVKKRIYRSLKRAWIGFKAKRECDHDKMKYYAEGIQKFGQLHLPASNFSNILKEKTRNDPDSSDLNNGGYGNQ